MSSMQGMNQESSHFMNSSNNLIAGSMQAMLQQQQQQRPNSNGFGGRNTFRHLVFQICEPLLSLLDMPRPSFPIGY